jgi:hypothetical protein
MHFTEADRDNIECRPFDRGSANSKAGLACLMGPDGGGADTERSAECL